MTDTEAVFFTAKRAASTVSTLFVFLVTLYAFFGVISYMGLFVHVYVFPVFPARTAEHIYTTPMWIHGVLAIAHYAVAIGGALYLINRWAGDGSD